MFFDWATQNYGVKTSVLVGGEGNDTLTGIKEEWCFINGYEGDDILKGEEANLNMLVGGEGYDQITGGRSTNIYVLTEGHGFDTITNFTDGRDYIITSFDGGINVTDLTVANMGGNALILYGDDLLAVVTGAAGMLEIGAFDSGVDNVLI